MDERTQTYTESDMVRVVVDDQVQPDPVPETWIGTDLLPEGAKKATKAQIAKADGTDDSGNSSPDSGSGSSGS